MIGPIRADRKRNRREMGGGIGIGPRVGIQTRDELKTQNFDFFQSLRPTIMFFRPLHNYK